MSNFAERFAGKDVAELETRAASGGLTPPGFYKAKLIGAKNVTAKSGNSGYELTFSIIDGPFKGGEVTETLWDTEHSRSQDRINLFCLRLGVLNRSPDGKKIIAVEGKQDFMDVLDTPCIIETHIEEYEREKGGTGHSVRLTYAGCHYPDDKEALGKIGKSVEAKGGAKSGTVAAAKSDPAKGAGAEKDKAPAAKSKVDTSQL